LTRASLNLDSGKEKTRKANEKVDKVQEMWNKELQREYEKNAALEMQLKDKSNQLEAKKQTHESAKSVRTRQIGSQPFETQAHAERKWREVSKREEVL